MFRFIKWVFTLLIMTFFSVGFGSMSSDIIFTWLSVSQVWLTTGWLAPGEIWIYQNSTPDLQGLLINNGPDDLFAWWVGGWLSSGFITCVDTVGALTLYSSSFINSFLVQAGTQQVINNIILPAGATANAGALLQLECTIDFNNEFNTTPTSIKTASIALRILETPVGRFDITLWLAKDSIKEKLDVAIPERWAGGVLQFILKVINTILIPIVIVIAIFLALIGFYKMFFSESADALSSWFGYVTWWVIGIVIMMLAPFIANTIYDTVLNRGENTAFSAILAVGQIYDLIVYPILKLLIYIVLGVLFIMLISRVFSYLSATQEEVIQKTRTTLVAIVVWMIVILWSNEVVEFIYGKEADIRNQNATQISEVWSPLLADPNLPIFYEIVRWIMALAVFAVLVIIIVQAFRLLMKPDDSEIISEIKSNLIYVFIGVLVIWASYLITNFFLIT